eukprot:scaffold22788_cov128-Isochrysis_galbana.AAC.3
MQSTVRSMVAPADAEARTSEAAARGPFGAAGRRRGSGAQPAASEADSRRRVVSWRPISAERTLYRGGGRRGCYY